MPQLHLGPGLEEDQPHGGAENSQLHLLRSDAGWRPSDDPHAASGTPHIGYGSSSHRTDCV